ncbi:MAG: PLP-dependent aminotransferase family protein [Clostridium sp.]|nr:PLP-dependent aminotransferase family protein [Clostridium sp.]MCM1459248.1 PLP-dependent aminotransferase family protein [Bacteroides sp.]
MLTYSFENIGSDTLYEHLYKSLKQDINTGVLSPDQKLPSKRSFAKNLSISTITVENAYAQLIAEGYIYSIPKKGYYVSKITNIENVPPRKFHFDNTEKHIHVDNNHDSSDVINLTSNHISADNFPFSIWSKLIRDVISSEKEALMKPLPSAGSYALRNAIAKHLWDYRGLDVNPEQIIIGAGTEYLYSIIIQLIGRDFIYGVEDPGYQKISKIYNSNSISCEYIPLTSCGVDTDILNKSNANVIHISPSHHFPTGIVTSAGTRYKLLAWANNADCRYIIEDDYDSEFRLVGKPIPALLSIDNNEKVIYMNSFSKSLSSTIRISYMILPKHLMDKYNEMLSFYACTVSSFEQSTLAKFISQGYFEKHINRMRNYYRKLRDMLLDAIKKSDLGSRCSILEENSGLHFLLRISTNKTDTQLKEDALKKGVHISFLSDYYMNPKNSEAHTIIVNYSSIRAENIDLIISKLCEVVD